jgi:hypothetical protein
MAVDINCSQADHASNSGYPGWANVVGTVPDGQTPPTGMICAGCHAANLDESLADAKARCIGDCWVYRCEQCEANTVEHPTSSGKQWPTSPDFRHYLTMLVTDDVGAITLRTADGLDEHAFADTAAVAALLAVVAAAVNTESGSCDTAISNICDATDVPAVEAARDAYTEA